MSQIPEPSIELEDQHAQSDPTVDTDPQMEAKLNDDPVEPTLDKDLDGDKSPEMKAQDPEPEADTEDKTAPENELPTGADPEPEKVEFKADFKYKVRDEEHEIDAWAKPFIKDEKTLNQFKDLYTRGHGLSLAKEERDEFKTKYSNLEASVKEVNNYVVEYMQNPTDPVVAASSARKFIEKLGLPPEMFMQYALEEFKYRQLPPEQRNAIDTQRAQEQRVNVLQQNQLTLEEQTHNLTVERNNLELDRSLSDTQVSGLVKAYDDQVGTPGAFRNMVVQRGIAHSARNVIKQPHEVVTEVAQELGKFLQGTGIQTGHVGTQANQPQQARTFTAEDLKQQRQKPVLPNISGQGGVSPVKKGYTSLDQLRQRYKELSV